MTIEIADRLVKLRKKNGLSQEELAEKLGLSRQAVSKWERAEASPDTDNLICLAKLYGISLDELLATEESVETIIEEQVKPEENKKGIRINKEEGIYIKDDEGASVQISKKGIECIDKEGKHVHKHIRPSKASIIISIVEGVLFTMSIVVYILLGTLLGMWYNAWVFLFIPGILASIARCIQKKNPNLLNVGFFSIFAFFFVCMVVPGLSANLWHPMWLVFLAIPLYHTTVGSIRKIIKKNKQKDDVIDYGDNDEED